MHANRRPQIEKKNYTTKIVKKSSKDHQQAQKENGMQKYNKQKPPKHQNGRYSDKKPTKDEEVAPTRMTTNCKKNRHHKNSQKKHQKTINKRKKRTEHKIITGKSLRNRETEGTAEKNPRKTRK